MDNIIHDTHNPHDPAEISDSQALTAAAAVIEDNGLAVGNFVDYRPGIFDVAKAPVCAAGAIRIAYGVDPDDGAYDRTCTALPTFADWLARTGRARLSRTMVPGEEIDLIGVWNDRTSGAAAVAAELRQAAAEIQPETRWRTSSHSDGECVQAAAIPGDCHGACTLCGGDGTIGGAPCGLCNGGQGCGCH